MEAVHDYGRRLGCSMAAVATMSFQGAKSFYEKLGYVSDFERHGYTQNFSCHFMICCSYFNTFSLFRECIHLLDDDEWESALIKAPIMVLVDGVLGKFPEDANWIV